MALGEATATRRNTYTPHEGDWTGEEKKRTMRRIRDLWVRPRERPGGAFILCGMGRVACVLAGYPRMEIEGISNTERFE